METRPERTEESLIFPVFEVIKANKVKRKAMRTFFITVIEVAGLLLATGVSGPVRGQTQNSHPARPGSINYVEGQASIGTEALSPNAVSSIELGKGQSLTTQAGKVEILLTPGVFLRVAENSTVKMISPDLANTEVELDKGRAMVEVLDIHKENNIRIDQNDVSTQLLKNGLYDFDADHEQIRALKGTAQVRAKGQNIKLTGERELALNAGGKLKAQTFDTRQYEDDFFLGALCGRDICRRLLSIKRASILAQVPPGMAPAGTARVGIGTHGLESGRLFQRMESSTAHLDGASIRRFSSIGLLSFSTVTTATNLIISTSSIIRMDTALSLPEVFVEEGSMAVSPAGVTARSCVRRLTQEDEVIAMRLCGASN